MYYNKNRTRENDAVNGNTDGQIEQIRFRKEHPKFLFDTKKFL